jgi:type VI secretion system secreted protein Hcp
MAVDMFMKVEGASGESQDANHKGWTDIDSFSWGATQASTMASGGGGGAGKVSFMDLNVVAKIDKCYPAVLKHCATGKHLGKVELSLCKAGGTQIEYGKIELTDVLVTSVAVSGTSSGETTVVNYSFQAAKVKSQYWEQTNTGGKGAESQVVFDVKQNKEG